MSQIVVFQHFLEEIAGEIAGDVEAFFMKMTSALRHRISVAGALELGWVWVWVVLSGLHLLEDVFGESPYARPGLRICSLYMPGSKPNE